MFAFSHPFIKESDVEDLFYVGLQVSEENNFIKLYLNPKNLPDALWILIYRMNFSGEAIQRKPNKDDESEDPKLYVHGDKCYFNIKEMAMPYLIVSLEKFR